MSVDAACGADGRGREAAYGEVAMRAFVSGAAPEFLHIFNELYVSL